MVYRRRAVDNHDTMFMNLYEYETNYLMLARHFWHVLALPLLVVHFMSTLAINSVGITHRLLCKSSRNGCSLLLVLLA